MLEIPALAIKLDFYTTFLLMVCVIVLGHVIAQKVRFLRDFDIPEPVIGGILMALVILILHTTLEIKISFDEGSKEPLMLAFFTCIGLGADFGLLKKGGKLLFVFLFLVAILLICQNILGVGLAMAMGVNPLLGLLGGSITLVGGHGTGAAWGQILSTAPYNFTQAMEAAMACATFGLVAGGIIGGPIAHFLIKHHKLKTPGVKKGLDTETHGFEMPEAPRLITADSMIRSLALIAIALFVGKFLDSTWKNFAPNFTIPTFVWCLFIGIILRNTLGALNIHQVFDREVSVLGNVALSLFLALALMSINLLELVALAVPLVVILTSQVVLMVLFSVFITFRFCGRNYDAAVLCAGQCGFGLGATPTAMVNMQTTTNHYGPSHIAFIIVPLIGAFCIDIINMLVLSGAIGILKGFL